MKIKVTATIFVAFFLLDLAQAYIEREEKILRYANADADMISEEDLDPPDLKEYNLCHIIDCDKEEEIARNESLTLSKKDEDIDYISTDEGNLDLSRYEEDNDYDSNDLVDELDNDAYETNEATPDDNKTCEKSKLNDSVNYII